MTYLSILYCPGARWGGEHSCVRWQRRRSAKNPYPSYRLRLQGNSLPSVGSRSKRLLRLAASRSNRHGRGELIPTTMLRVLRGKILRPETVHASELIIAVERPLLLDKMPMVANVQAAPAQPGRTQTPFGNGRALRWWQSGRGRSVRISRIPVPVSAADRKKPRFLSPPSFAPPVYPGVPSLIPHALLDAGLLGSQQELRSG